ncbi:MAG: hypothetical protein A3G25_04140 [Betaproteobacteria bacterium RIFCSPLOWO2_12_FULL_63_13]|nr:MAG: hypothetical protein A3H32_08300 [Betaproteobacteria bacterium RIFCSPLOWO2_02_FULL_63_19]OGA52885.1 MAG: hypothetical protein A3G25_04140 [Betaproteobacteria bacterium RIFCSPLOWO2_12_FULL_63_13]
MTQSADFPQIEKRALLERLAERDCARTTVVTPNQRLAAAVRRDFNERQVAAGFTVWETADILPLAAFTERLYEHTRYCDLAIRPPILLAPAQEHALWEDIVRSSQAGGALLWAQDAAALAREAWQLAHAWRLMPRLKDYPANDDARAFLDWAWRYEGVTQRNRYCDRARLADVVVANLAHPALRKPATLVVYGFDMLNLQQHEFLGSLAKAGVEILAAGPETRNSDVRRVVFASAKEEIRAVAKWARARLEAEPRARIGVVVPELELSRALVMRIFARVMEPAQGLAGTLPFNLSLGQPLTSYAPVAAAMGLLKFVQGEIAFEQASRLLLSPFIAGAESELAQRARLDVALRKVSAARTSLERLRRVVSRLTADAGGHEVVCPILSQRLADLSRFARENLHGAKRPDEWAKLISALLAAVGFPGERTLDSIEYQALKKFHAAVAGFAALERVTGRMRFREACSRLARLVSDMPFQPQAPEVPIQVLGVLESAGLEFDHLWVTGLTDEVWPMPARPNPFIPVALQRAAAVPEASSAASFEVDARITRGWRAAAFEVVFSHPLREQDRELVPSSFIGGLPECSVEDLVLPEYATLHEMMRRGRGEERVPDARAPALVVPASTSGGTGVFRDQAACPFRAFAVHRLRAEGLAAPASGLDAADRGTLLHAMLAKLWQELKSKARLEAASDADLDSLLAAAAGHALARLRARRPDAMENRFAELERSRLVKLGRAWLDVERARTSFEVAAIEHVRVLSFGGISVNARLDRLDRIAEAGGSGQACNAVIDYKTGSANVGDWLGPRPDDPQLPLYAVSMGEREPVCAVAFARLKAGDMAFKGIAREEGLIPGAMPLAGQRLQAAKGYESWEDLIEGWRIELDTLGKEFASGEAHVAPKRGDDTCRYCELKPLCRISERAPAGGDEATL